MSLATVEAAQDAGIERPNGPQAVQLLLRILAGRLALCEWFRMSVRAL